MEEVLQDIDWAAITKPVLEALAAALMVLIGVVADKMRRRFNLETKQGAASTGVLAAEEVAWRAEDAGTPMTQAQTQAYAEEVAGGLARFKSSTERQQLVEAAMPANGLGAAGKTRPTS